MRGTFLGIPNSPPAKRSTPPAALRTPPPPTANPNEALEPPTDSSTGAPRLWDACQPLPGTLAELYLRNRGITDTAHDALRFHPKLRYRDDNYVTYRPAMVACVRGADGQVNAVHRTWLDATGLDKAQLPQPKKLLDRSKGAGVLFHPERMAKSDIVVGEGIETVLSVLSALPDCAGIATLTSSVMAGIPIPPLDRAHPHRRRPGPGRLSGRLQARGPPESRSPQCQTSSSPSEPTSTMTWRPLAPSPSAGTYRPSSPRWPAPNWLSLRPTPPHPRPTPPRPRPSPPARPVRPTPEPILNLSRAQLSPELREAGVIDLHETDRKALVKALFLKAAPGPYQIRKCAGIWADIAKVAAERANTRKVLVLVDTWLIGPLERELRARGLEPVHAFMQSVQVQTPEGRQWTRKFAGIVPSLTE